MDEASVAPQGGAPEEAARRLLDVAVALAGLVVTSPVLLAAAVAIKLDSPGPVFFRQTRVGLNGKPFQILKLRSMRQDAEQRGGQLTVGADPRVTGVGKFLRKWKLDELPQLINVLVGDMALVGPRPEVPRYVELYSPEQRRVLSVRPGITDPASIRYRNESELMASAPDPESYYREVLMPRKLSINLEYLANRTLASDFRVLLDTARAVLTRSSDTLAS